MSTSEYKKRVNTNRVTPYVFTLFYCFEVLSFEILTIVYYVNVYLRKGG